MSYHFIRSTTLRSYECRGKETWFQLQVFPVDEPVYRIYRCYDDFLRLDAQLDNIYATGVAHSHTSPDFTHEDRCHSSSHRRVLSYGNQLCEANCPSATTDHAQVSLPNLRSHHPTQEIYWLANKRAKRKWQQQHIDRYLSRLFAMPLNVSQSPIVLRFLNYQPYRCYYHYNKSLPPTPPTLRRPIFETSHPLSTGLSPFLPSNGEGQTGESTAASLSTNSSIKSGSSNTDTPVSQAVTLIPQRSPSFVHSWNEDMIQIFLFLNTSVFITVRIHRRSSLNELRSAIDQELFQRGLDPLPLPSVLAYHHVNRSDRQGALYTLTLNCSEPWLDQDTLMNLASARNLTFFSKAANYVPPFPETQSNQHQIYQGVVLLIASDADLEAAMNGKWRRLDHVTLTCLAW